MLEIVVHETELFDEATSRFINVPQRVLHLEHSLYSLSKWEQRHHKSFLFSEKTDEEIVDYIRCMTDEKIPDECFKALTEENIRQLNDYIDNPMTATTFSNERNKGGSKKKITSEQIYYWMSAFNIPFDREHQHLNSLLTLIKVCGLENAPKKKMPKSEVMKHNRSLNAERRRLLNSNG